MPNVMDVKIKYVSNVTRQLAFPGGGGASGVHKLFKLNSLCKPDNSATQPEPMALLSEYASLWTLARVMATKITLSFNNSGGSTVHVPLIGYLFAYTTSNPSGTPPALVTSADILIRGLQTNAKQVAWKRIIGVESGKTTKVKKYFSLPRLSGEPTNYKGEAEYVNTLSGAATTGCPNDPTTAFFIQYGIFTQNGGTLTSQWCDIMVQATFYVRLSKKDELENA